MAFPIAKLFKNIQTGGRKETIPGNYIATVDNVSVGNSKKGRLQVAWFFLVDKDSPQMADETIAAFHALTDNSQEQEDEMGIANMGKFISKLEMAPPSSESDVDTPEKLQVYLKGAIGRQVRLNVKQNGDFINVYIDKLISAGNGKTIPLPGLKAVAPFKVGDVVLNGGAYYTVKSLMDGGRLIGLDANNSARLMEVKDCKIVDKPHTEKGPTPEVSTSGTIPGEEVEIKEGMQIAVTFNGKRIVGRIIDGGLNEDAGQVTIIDPQGSFFTVSVDQVNEIVNKEVPKADNDGL